MRIDLQSDHLPDHDHHLDLEAALDFLNTNDLDDGVRREDLQVPEDARAYFVDRGVLHDDTPVWSAADLDHVRGVRDALREVVDAIVEARTPELVALERVNAAMAAGRTARLEIDAGHLRVGHTHRTDAVDSALAAAIEPVVATLATEGPARFRVCANDRCRWTFYDTSPTARRRWCDMRTCGNRAKAARHRAKARSTPMVSEAPMTGGDLPAA